ADSKEDSRESCCTDGCRNGRARLGADVARLAPKARPDRSNVSRLGALTWTCVVRQTSKAFGIIQSMSQLTENVVLDALRQIKDPDLHKDIVTLGFIKDLSINDGNVSFRIVLTTPACPVKSEMESAARELVSAIAEVRSVEVTMDA